VKDAKKHAAVRHTEGGLVVGGSAVIAVGQMLREAGHL